METSRPAVASAMTSAAVVVDPSLVAPDKHPDAPADKQRRRNSREQEAPPVPPGEMEMLAHAMSPDPGAPSGKTATPPMRATAARGRSGPAGAGMASLPDAPLSPAKGSTAEELRVWTARMFMKLENDMDALRLDLTRQKQQESDTRKGLEKVNTKLEVVHAEHEEFGKVNVKAIVTELEKKVQAATEISMKVQRDAAMDLHTLRGELSEFAAKIDGNNERLTKVDAEFKGHLEGNFHVLEKEFGDIRRALSAAGPTPATGTVSVGHAVSLLEFNLMKAKVESYEKSFTELGNRLIVVENECHCHHVDTLMKEMTQVKIDIVNLQARGAKAVGGSADGGADSVRHADQLLQRVMQIEAAMKATSGDPWSRPSTAATTGAAAAPSEQHVGGNPSQTAATGTGLPGDPAGSWPNRDAHSWTGGGGSGGHGPGGGGDGGGWPRGGGGGPPGIPGHDGHGECQFPDPSRIEYHKLFDDKIAATEPFRYNGAEGAAGEAWRTTVRGYVGTKVRIMLNVLEWAEAQDDKEITGAMVSEMVRSGAWLTEVNIFRVSEAFWGFLNICLHGAAKEAFKQANMLDGLNAWRLVVYEMRSSMWVHIKQLRTACKHVKPIERLEDLGSHIMRYETNIRDYVAAAGKHVQPTEEDMKETLMESLPKETREILQTRLGAMARNQSYTEFKNEIRATANTLLYHRGKIKSGINAVVGGQQPQPAQGEQEPGTQDGAFSRMNPDEQYDAVMAFFKGMKGGGKGGGPRQPGPAREDGGTRKCVNCGSKEHLTQNCTKPQLPREQRPCWKCGKPGHVGANCPNVGKGGVKGNTNAVEDHPQGQGGVNVCFMMDLADSEKYERLTPFQVPSKTARPVPRVPCVDDYITKNSFAALADGATANQARKNRKRERRLLIKPFFEQCANSKCTDFDCTNTNCTNLNVIRTDDPDDIFNSSILGLTVPMHETISGPTATCSDVQQQPADVQHVTESPSAPELPSTVQQELADVQHVTESACQSEYPSIATATEPNTHEADTKTSTADQQSMESENCDLHTPELQESDDEDEPIVVEEPEEDVEEEVDDATLCKRIDEAISALEAKGEQVPALMRQFRDLTHVFARTGQCGHPDAGAGGALAKAEAIAREAMIIEHEDIPDGQIMAAEETMRKIRVALDSGAVDHIAHPSSLPGEIRLLKDGTIRNFVSASGDSIRNHGKARVKLRTKDGNVIGNVFQVADVCRPLHSVSRICDQGHEVLFTAEEGIVVPKGTFAKFLENFKGAVARYPREAGLYVAEMDVKAGDPPAEDFPRQGPAR